MQRLSEAPEVVQALAKAEEYARLAVSAKTAKDRNDLRAAAAQLAGHC